MQQSSSLFYLTRTRQLDKSDIFAISESIIESLKHHFEQNLIESTEIDTLLNTQTKRRIEAILQPYTKDRTGKCLQCTNCK